MKIEICKWYNNADSPVLFMIDDLANVWVDTNQNGVLDPGEDWGYWRNEEHSSFRYLNEQLLVDFPQVKATFFVPVGVRTDMITNSEIHTVSQLINANEDSIAFFRSIHEDPRFELAYHGTTHGVAGGSAEEFMQEWEVFGSVEEAVSTIKEGKQIFQSTAGEPPRGGKYCGYMSNEYSDTSINDSGFEWWCRYWNRGFGEHVEGVNVGDDPNPITNYDIKRFGSNGVIDIPSTIDGALFTDLFHPSHTWKGKVKQWLKPIWIRRRSRQLQQLLDQRLVINVQEHIAPSRNDGVRQSPNLFDDTESLRLIFDYLSRQHVWYCTGSELADYVNLRDRCRIRMLDSRRFYIDSDFNDDFNGRELTLSFELDKKLDNGMIHLITQGVGMELVLPDQRIIHVHGGIAQVPLMRGIYVIQ